MSKKKSKRVWYCSHCSIVVKEEIVNADFNENNSKKSVLGRLLHLKNGSSPVCKKCKSNESVLYADLRLDPEKKIPNLVGF